MTAKEYLQERKTTELNRKTFTNRLNIALAQRGLTQKQAAELCKVSTGSFWRYLHGNIPSAQVLYSIAENLNISVDWLLGLQDEAERG